MNILLQFKERKMKINVDFYKETGKWYAEDIIEIDEMYSWDINRNFISSHQKALLDCKEYTILIEILESTNDVNIGYKRLISV
jgi:hypothetical protein